MAFGLQETISSIVLDFYFLEKNMSENAIDVLARTICVERIGDVVTVYSGGVPRATLTTADRPGGGLGVSHIGQDTGAPWPTLNGYIDEIRLTKRTGGRYGGAYSPATSEFHSS